MLFVGFSSSSFIICIILFLVYWFFIKNPNYYIDQDDKKTNIKLSETEETYNNVKKLFIKTSKIPKDMKILLTVDTTSEFIEKNDDDYDKEYTNAATIKIKLVDTSETLSPTCETNEYLDTTSNTCVTEPYTIGQSVSCATNDPQNAIGAVYRYMGKKNIRYYMSPELAATWDPNWGSDVKQIPDCTGYTKGFPMGYNNTSGKKCSVKVTKCPNNDADFKEQYGQYNVWNTDIWAKDEQHCLNQRKQDFKDWCGITDTDFQIKWE